MKTDLPNIDCDKALVMLEYMSIFTALNCIKKQIKIKKIITQL